jgi:hypothetical protein
MVSKEPTATPLQPYLSALLVSTSGTVAKKIGRALVRCESTLPANGLRNISTRGHGWSAALNPYRAEGYCDAGERWNPIWKGPDAKYFVKNIAAH